MADIPVQCADALRDRYAIERELGRGGMATVYLARDLRHGRLVALKVLRPELSALVGRERFARETAVAARLNHPNILPLFDSGSLGAGSGDPVVYYTMPYVEGRSLRERLREEPQLPVDEAVGIARQVAEALDHAHQQGIVHRDIKPENVLLAGMHAFVADFGIARALGVAGGERLTETGLSLGTPAYMSPEQAAADGRLDARSDLYSLGCMLYEMLAGQPPFTGSTAQSILARHAVDPVPSLRTVRPTVPPALEQAVTRALAKVPADRFATAGAFARALVAPPAAATTLRVARIALASRRKWLVAATVLASAALAVAAATTLRVRPPPVYQRGRVVVAPIEYQTGDSTLGRFSRQLLTTLPDAIAREGVGDPVPAATVRDILARATGSAGDVAERLARETRAGLELRGVCTRGGAAGAICQVDLLRMPAKALRISVSTTGDPAQPAFGAELTERVLVALLLQRTYGDEASWQGEYVPRSLAALRAFQQGMDGHEADAREHFRDAMRLDSGWAHAAAAFAVADPNGEAAESTITRLLRRPELLSGERETVAWHLAARQENGELAYRLAERRFAVNSPWWFARLATWAWLTDRPNRALQASRYQDAALAPVGGVPDFGGSAYVTRGAVLHQLGRYREELQLARELRRRFPHLVHIYRTQEVMALAALGEVDSLRRRLAEWEGTPEEAGMAGTRGFIAGLELMAHGYPREGREILVGTLPHYRRDETGSIQEVMILTWTDQLKAARRLALARLRTARSVGDSLNYAGALGSIAARQGDRPEAARYDRLLAAERPRDLVGEAIMLRVAIASCLGDLEGAVRLLEQARLRHPDFLNTHSHLHRWAELAALRGYPPFQRFLAPRD